jgi:glucans biosynthesis protein
VDGEAVTNFEFTPDQFDYGKNRFAEPLPKELKFAGLRILYPVNSPRKQDEVASFVGASYFRLIGARQRFGASARGLAIDTAEPSGEEFPRFTDYWILKPGKGANSMELFALLDSPSAAGAYRFVIKPGQTMALDIEVTLFFRKDIRKPGLAALTSMFLVGANRSRFIPDYRPEVHDSDGLLVHTKADEWLWRPLVNPEKEHRVTRFGADDIRGFGLLQRARDFRDYEDLEGRFDLRPSLWVEPRDSWGAGEVELVEIPTPSEWNGNIVAYWVPREKALAGHELRWTYSVYATIADPQRPPLLRVQSTRIAPEHDKLPLRFVVDFTGDTLPALKTNAVVSAEAHASRGEVRNVMLEHNEITGGWRVFLDYPSQGNEDTQLRLWLRRGDQVLSERWVYDLQKR